MENGESKILLENDVGQQDGASVEIPIKRRGRPPGSKNRNTPLDTGTPKKAGNESVSSNADDSNKIEAAKFIALGVLGIVELAESAFHSNLATKIEKRLPDKLGEFKDMAETVRLTKGEKDLSASCLEKIALRYDALTNNAPEVLLAVVMLQYGARQLSLNNFVEKVTKQKPVPLVSKTEVQPQGQ